MLNFSDKFFFSKFSILFFVVTIFGYWGIDLNSEEIYIAFSFFLVIILGYIFSKNFFNLLFIKIVNYTANQYLSADFYVIGYMRLEYAIVEQLFSSLKSIINLSFNLQLLVTNAFGLNTLFFRSREIFLSSFRIFYSNSLASFYANTVFSKKFVTFRLATNELFVLNFKK